MLQQTTVVTVGPYFMKFIRKWPTVKDLAKASQDEVLTAWAGLGYYARARNLHKCAQVVVKDFKGHFPETMESLIALPGIGPYTAAAISSIAFDHPAVAVDGNVERVVSRFFAIEEPLPLSKETIRRKAESLAKDTPRPGDFTQAFMELGATVCTPRQPKCFSCPWKEACIGRKKDIAEALPRKLAKKKKPVKYGKVFWIQDSRGAFLIEKRQGRGLYQGMYQLPTTAWTEDKKYISKLVSPLKQKMRIKPLGVEVRHSFTHFDLILEIWGGRTRTKAGTFIFYEDIKDYALPTLMKKAIRLCQGA